MGRKILWLSTGGTIVSRDNGGGLSPDENAALRELCAPLLPSGVSVDILSPFCIDSSLMTPELQARLATQINERISEYDGVVVTHGTDTMAYTAAALFFMLKNPPVPVALTGSQLSFFEEGSDAPRNLSDAFAVASCGEIHDVCVVFGGEIFPADRVYKAYSRDPRGFISADRTFGRVREGAVRIASSDMPSPKRTPYAFTGAINRRVAVIKVTPGMRGDMLRFAAEAGYNGVLLEAFGLGGFPGGDFLEALAELRERGVDVCAVSQCVYDGADLGVYAVGRAALALGVKTSAYPTTEAALAQMLFG